MNTGVGYGVFHRLERPRNRQMTSTATQTSLTPRLGQMTLTAKLTQISLTAIQTHPNIQAHCQRQQRLHLRQIFPRLESVGRRDHEEMQRGALFHGFSSETTLVMRPLVYRGKRKNLQGAQGREGSDGRRGEEEKRREEKRREEKRRAFRKWWNFIETQIPWKLVILVMIKLQLQCQLRCKLRRLFFCQLRVKSWCKWRG